jgi:hypothetical protein
VRNDIPYRLQIPRVEDAKAVSLMLLAALAANVSRADQRNTA